MGIPNSWKEIEGHPSMREISLRAFMIADAKQRVKRGERLARLGVDVSPWIYSVQAASMGARHKGGSWARVGHASEMKDLLTRLEQLVNLPVTLIFFFDGENRPEEKRDTRVNSATHSLLPHFRDLLSAFNVAMHNSPGEAEADLADFNQRGQLDFVMTSDSDIFLFGARNVIRTPRNRENWDIAQYYASRSQGDRVQFSKAGWVFSALLGGGDYSPGGLQGCGFPSAWALAQSSLAPDLLDAINAHHGGDRAGGRERLIAWRQALSSELASNSFGLLKSHHRFLSHQVSKMPGFPSMRIAELYAFPVTSVSEGLDHGVESKWGEGLPITDAITRQLYRQFHWSWETIYEHLCSSVWPASCIRELLRPNLANVPHKTAKNCLGAPAVISVKGIKSRKAFENLPFSMYQVEVSLVSVVKKAICAYQQESHTILPQFVPGRPEDIVIGNLLIPEPIIRYGTPAAVTAFENRKKKKPAGRCRTAKRNCSAGIMGRSAPSKVASPFRETRKANDNVIVISDNEMPATGGSEPGGSSKRRKIERTIEISSGEEDVAEEAPKASPSDYHLVRIGKEEVVVID
ncbi:PIN domain-like protein [Coprinopsis sp. MPI-PUGE-AT-0042]|nr:PIN domain-like protein [Coprinopsis sp. MPI-PUGE-AT-0042]